MNKPLALILSAAVTLPLLGCGSDPDPRNNTVFHEADQSPRTGMTQRPQRFGYRGTNSSSTAPSNTGSRQADGPDNPNDIVMPRDAESGTGGSPGLAANDPNASTPGDGTGTPGSAPATKAEAPYAEAVPNKYGLVYSPFVSDKKKALVNVTDENNVPLPPGTEVQCPLTGKIFRVP